MNNYIYMDNAATTKIREEVLEAMMPFLKEDYGNPSSTYSIGVKTKKAIEEARKSIGEKIGASEREIYFTSGGSEADNWAIKGVAYANKDKGKHIITSKVEHHAVLHTCEYLEKQGFEVTYLDVDEYGMISLRDLEDAIREDTILISIMFANNEVGTIMPIKEIGEIAKAHKIYFHTDAVQAVGTLKIDVDELNIDMLSMSAHKFHGPRGIGGLYIRRGVKIDALIIGGGQERSRRAGTENTPAIVGMAKALELAYTGYEARNEKLTRLRDLLIDKILTNIKYTRLNGHPSKRLPGNVNISVEFIEGESMLLSLDMMGIAASSGSACTSGSLDPSHVLLAMGLTHEIAHGSLRLSISEENTEEEIDYLVESLAKIVDRLRMMSPLYEKIIKGEN